MIARSREIGSLAVSPLRLFEAPSNARRFSGNPENPKSGNCPSFDSVFFSFFQLASASSSVDGCDEFIATMRRSARFLLSPSSFNQRRKEEGERESDDRKVMRTRAALSMILASFHDRDRGRDRAFML